MKLTTKKAVYRAMTTVCWTAMGLMVGSLVISIGGSIYADGPGTRGEEGARTVEAEQVEQAFTRTKGLKEDYEKYAARHKALSGPEMGQASEVQRVLAQQTLEKKYAYEASVTAQAVQIISTHDIPVSAAKKAAVRLTRENTGVVPEYIAGGAKINSYLHVCQRETPAGSTPETLAVCMDAYKDRDRNLTIAFILAMGAITLVAAKYRDKLERQIPKQEKEEREKALQDAQEKAAMPVPLPPAPVPFDPSTGQDITIKPIKITAKAPTA